MVSSFAKISSCCKLKAYADTFTKCLLWDICLCSKCIPFCTWPIAEDPLEGRLTIQWKILRSKGI